MTKLVRFSPIRASKTGGLTILAETVNRIQDRIAVFAASLFGSRLLSQHDLLSVKYVSGTNRYPHGLGRKTQGVLAFGTTAITDAQASNPRTDKEVWITAGASGTATILVY